MPTDMPDSHHLIGSDKVEGTAVFGADGERIGAIQRVMIDKLSGQVAYAVLSFGGFLGVGDDHTPLPWPSLKYNVELGGYQIMIPIEKLKDGPKFAADAESGIGARPARAASAMITARPR